MIRPPRRSTLFPYTTLFRSYGLKRRLTVRVARRERHASASGDAIRESARSSPIQRDSHGVAIGVEDRSEEHTSELQSLRHLVCRLLLEKKNTDWHEVPNVVA